ncbi:endolytic transglycosylase MltG [candidate division WOR-3 bacterium]|nr:endolytic transglycosylase MltG [candidate division WOR-3 bacterium]
MNEGETTSRITDRLNSLGIISHPRRFVMKARVAGLDKRLQQGVYRLHTSMSEDSVLLVLSSGAIATVSVTVPEGLTLTKIADRLVTAGLIDRDSFLALCADEALLREYKIPFSTFEGILFPDTYKFPVGASEEMIIRIMASRFFEVAEKALKKVPLDTLVIMASIVEHEAYLSSERPVVASVFYNRLKKGMALESCATVEYALPEHKENLTYADLRIPSDYNTYLHPGLPPGPICSPGKASLEAAANPAKTEYLYFVSKGDGSHHFSRTAAEHERMKRKINSAR